MQTIKRDLYIEWNRPDNGLSRIIIINVGVFVVLNLLYLVAVLSGNESIFQKPLEVMILPLPISEFLFKPWTLLTSAFTQVSIFHLLGNMLMLYYFGRIVSDMLGNKHLLGLYFLSAIFGASMLLLIKNLAPGFTQASFALGASGAVNGVMIAAATCFPNYRLNLLLFGPVKLLYIALVGVFLSIIGTVGANPGGELVHLAGALFGYIYAEALKSGRDWSKPVVKTLNFLRFSPEKKVRMSANKVTPKKAAQKKVVYPERPNQEVVDMILDKISEKGYNSLTTEEKQTLFKASQLMQDPKDKK